VVKLSVLGGIDPPSMLFPGDLSDWTGLILRQAPNLQADILKLPHHGSKAVGWNTAPLQHLYHLCDDWRRFFRQELPFWYEYRLDRAQAFLYRFVYLADQGSLAIVNEIVKPSHVLVFPHPQHHLPDLRLDDLCAQILANRRQRGLADLNQKSNQPAPAQLSVGLERSHREDSRRS
jgi:hypothetical protein